MNASKNIWLCFILAFLMHCITNPLYAQPSGEDDCPSWLEVGTGSNSEMCYCMPEGGGDPHFCYKEILNNVVSCWEEQEGQEGEYCSSIHANTMCGEHEQYCTGDSGSGGGNEGGGEEEEPEDQVVDDMQELVQDLGQLAQETCQTAAHRRRLQTVVKYLKRLNTKLTRLELSSDAKDELKTLKSEISTMKKMLNSYCGKQ